MTIDFNEELYTGNELIDNQHKELIDRIAKFVSACELGESKVKAIKMLDYMDEYTNFHFNAEEELQKKEGYPELSIHQKKHEEFKNTVKTLYELLDEKEGPDQEFVEIVKKNVVEWLLVHIKGADRSVAEYIQFVNNPNRL